MQRHLAGGLAALLVACTPVKGLPMSTESIRISAACRDNPRCVFDGRDIFIDIQIANQGQADISLPLSYLKKRGPIVKLTDTRTQRETYTGPNLVDPALQSELVTLRPAQSVSMEWVITEFELHQFDSWHVDLVAEITVQTMAQSEGRAIELRGSDALHIVGDSSAPQ